MRRILSVLLFAAAQPGLAAVPATADAVLACMRANVPPAVRIQTIELTTYDRGGEGRTLQGRIFGARQGGQGRLLARVEQPHDLSGASFLVRESGKGAEIYTYLPSVNRVKRLTGAAMTGRLWNTDFSYNEFRQVQGDFSGTAATLEPPGVVADRPVAVLALTPPAGQGESYDGIRLFVDQESCVPLAVEFARAGTVRKRLTVPPTGLARAGTRWFPAEMTLADLVTGTRTHLRVLDVSMVESLPPRYFHPQQFHAVR